MVSISDDIETTLVGAHDINSLIVGHHLNGDNGGLYVEVLSTFDGLRVYPEKLRATSPEDDLGAE